MNTNTKDNSSPNQRGQQSRGERRSGDGRQSRGNNRSRSRRERSNYGTREAASAKPLTFWQKIVAFFSGKKTPDTAPVREQQPPRPQEQRGHENRTTEDRNGRPSDSYRRLDNPPGEERATREPRQSETVEVTTPKLYVGNLSYETTESDLSELFNGVGSVVSAEVVSNQYTQKSKGFAFVILATVDEAKRAVTELHDKEFMGRKLIVNGAKPSERRA